MDTNAKKTSSSAATLARELAGQDIRGLVALGFFAAYLITAFLA